MKIFYSNFTEKIMNLISWWSNTMVIPDLIRGLGIQWLVRLEMESFPISLALDSRVRRSDKKWALLSDPLDKAFQVGKNSTHYPLPTTHYPLPTTHYPLPTTHYPLPTTHYPLPTALSTQHSALSTQHSALPKYFSV
jgi:hypothetical protein